MYHSRVAQVNNIIRKLEDCKTEIEYVARKSEINIDCPSDKEKLSEIANDIGNTIKKLSDFVS